MLSIERKVSGSDPSFELYRPPGWIKNGRMPLGASNGITANLPRLTRRVFAFNRAFATFSLRHQRPPSCVKSWRYSETGLTPVSIRYSRARVHATYSRRRSVS